MTFRSLALSVSLLMTSTLASAASIRVAFQSIGDAAIPQGPVTDGSLVPEAGQVMWAKYGAERGMRGYAEGSQGELLVLTREWNNARAIFSKMLRAGDVVVTDEVPYFMFPSVTDVPPVNPLAGFVSRGRIDIYENGYGKFWFINQSAAIKRFAIAMNEMCPLKHAVVLSADGTFQPSAARLVASHRVGSYAIGYEYEVNGGEGANIAGIQITIGPVGGPVVQDICPVNVLVKY